jgi:AcrR family transcriptional regulator
MTNLHSVAEAKLLDAEVAAFRIRAYAATTIDDRCLAAGVSAGASFHQFPSAEDLGVAAATHWTAVTAGLFKFGPWQVNSLSDARITNISRDGRWHRNIVVCDVSTLNLVRTRMAKAVLDSGWGMLRAQLQYKGESAGRSIRIVSERNTSRTC